ncbi:MAG TPA: adenylate/guanylate cyclase domain-containing protein [Treponemataceae bacterium]|nr:adenylate/guanylate cyclase domain-containing protein [Treponemataceae bacterium]
MKKVIERIFGKKIQGVRVTPLVLKIVFIFTVFLLVSNFVSNYINLVLNQGEQLRLMNELLIKDLKELHVFAMNQREIYLYNRDLETTLSTIEKSAEKSLKGEKSTAFGVTESGEILFFASKATHLERITDPKTLETLKTALVENSAEGSIHFSLNRNQYFGMFKYNPEWKVFLVRAEEMNEFYGPSRKIFNRITLIIVIFTLICIVVGVFLIQYILRYVRKITKGIMTMQESQKLGIIDLAGAPNDEITYLGAAFNSTSSTIDNLLNIFKKFVPQDIAQQAYRDREIRLAGSQRELTILFSDIKGFTFITEALGTDIIKLLNIHYERAIHKIHRQNGIIGSIIGDALLAIYGAYEVESENKSLEAIKSAYHIQQVASDLRQEMYQRREGILKKRGSLTAIEEKIYKAVLLEVGVGIDGGEVFYGNIGSPERMTNTVIGDNVNSASRLEGLTRIYKVPVICSEYVMNDVLESGCSLYQFQELDQVQVKGKTVGKKVYWPVEKDRLDDELINDLALFNKGLISYYEGDWEAAFTDFKQCTLPLVAVFLERTVGKKSPKGWNGIWTMTTK